MKLESKELRVVLTLAALQFTHMLDFVVMMPLAPNLMRSFNLTPSQFGLLVSVYTWSSACFGFVGSFFVDRYDRKRCLLFLYAGFIVGTALCAIAKNPQTLLIGRILAGAFAGVQTATIYAIMGDLIPEARRGTAMGILMVAFPIASILGIPAGLLIANQSSWQVTFAALALLSIILLTLGGILLPRMSAHLRHGAHNQAELFQKIRHIFQERQHYWTFSTMICLQGSSFLLVPYLSPFLVKNIEIPETKLYLIYLVGGAFSFFTSQIFGRLSDRIGKKFVFQMLMICSIVPPLMISHLSAASLTYVLTLTTFYIIFNSGRMVPAMAIITSSVEPARRGGFMSLVTATQYLSMGIATYAGGLMLEKASDGKLEGYDRASIVAAILTLIAIVLASRIRPKSAPKPGNLT